MPLRVCICARVLQAYVLEALGQKYVEPQAFKLDAVFADSAAAVPLIFVLSFGSDPMADLLKFADERRKQVRACARVQACGAQRGTPSGSRSSDHFCLELAYCAYLCAAANLGELVYAPPLACTHVNERQA